MYNSGKTAQYTQLKSMYENSDGSLYILSLKIALAYSTINKMLDNPYNILMSNDKLFKYPNILIK